MINKISKTDEIRASVTVTYLDKPEHVAAIANMNEQMEKVRREYQIKDRNSQIAAASVILTA